jgi:hypothetical protein
VVQEIDRLLDHHTYAQIAAILNERGMRSGQRHSFHGRLVARVQRSYGLQSRYDRLRARGLLTLKELAALLRISPSAVKIWHHHGLVRGHPYNDKKESLYEHPGNYPPRKAQGIKLSQRLPRAEVVVDRSQEVQCEA